MSGMEYGSSDGRSSLTGGSKHGSVGPARPAPRRRKDPDMTMLRAGVLAACVALAAPSLAAAQVRNLDDATLHDQALAASTRFRCQDGGELLARFATERGQLVA